MRPPNNCTQHTGAALPIPLVPWPCSSGPTISAPLDEQGCCRLLHPGSSELAQPPQPCRTQSLIEPEPRKLLMESPAPSPPQTRLAAGLLHPALPAAALPAAAATPQLRMGRQQALQQTHAQHCHPPPVALHLPLVQTLRLGTRRCLSLSQQRHCPSRSSQVQIPWYLSRPK